MGILFTGAFWGVILILLGASILIKVIFNVDIPVMRIVFGLIIIAVGINIVIGKRVEFKGKQNIVFGDSRFEVPKGGNEYNVVFGKGLLDLRSSGKPPQAGIINFKSNTVFGETEIILSRSQQYRIRASAAFGAVTLPDGSIVSFGSNQFATPSLNPPLDGSPDSAFDPNKSTIAIEANAVFGACKIIFAD